MRCKKRYLINNRRSDSLLKKKFIKEATSLIQADVFAINVLACLLETPKFQID